MSLFQSIQRNIDVCLRSALDRLKLKLRERLKMLEDGDVLGGDYIKRI